MAEAPSVALKDLQKDVVRMRDKEEKPWHEIAGETGEAAGKCMLAWEMYHLPPSEKVTYKSDADLAKKVVGLRDKQKLSWASIIARTDVPESRLRTLYETIEGEGSTKGNRIGKGGRHPNGVVPAGKVTKKATKAVRAKKAPAKKTAAKKAPAKKAAAKKASGSRKAAGGAAPLNSGMVHPLEALDFSGLADRLEGRSITVTGATGNDRVYKVKAVRSLEDGNMEFSDAKTGNIHTVAVTSIKRASK